MYVSWQWRLPVLPATLKLTLSSSCCLWPQAMCKTRSHMQSLSSHTLANHDEGPSATPQLT